MTKQAPEIYQKSVEDIDLSGLPPRGTADFDQAIITRYALEYAARGWNAVVTVDDQYVRVVAVPEQGIEPKTYVIGLLKHGYLEDALPILEALSGMIDDADIEYNFGICLSELGRIEESVAPLERCIALDPQYTLCLIGLGVAYTRLGRSNDAERALREAIRQEPANAFAKRNLAAVLANSGKLQEALPLFRQAASLTPNDPSVQLGLAQCLEQLGGDQRKEADKLYEQIAKRFPNHPVAEIARVAINKIADEDLHAAVDGNIRMDVVFYMQGAMEHFSAMPKELVGKIVMEIANLGQSGLKINEPETRYHLENMEGDFSGLHLLCLMHVGFRMFDPEADTGTGLNREYAAAVAMLGGKA